MRWALRNQKKIEEKLGRKTLIRITIALNRHFKENKEIESRLCTNDSYETITIKDVGEGYNAIEFYIIRQTFDVYNLALKGIIK